MADKLQPPSAHEADAPQQGPPEPANEPSPAPTADEQQPPQVAEAEPQEQASEPGTAPLPQDVEDDGGTERNSGKAETQAEMEQDEQPPSPQPENKTADQKTEHEEAKTEKAESDEADKDKAEEKAVSEEAEKKKEAEEKAESDEPNTAKVASRSEEPEQRDYESDKKRSTYSEDLEWKTQEEGVDFCFSGGGIRACAIAAGAFEGVLRDKAPNETSAPLLYRPRFYSCVSGGGYFGGYLASVIARTAASAPDAGDSQWLTVLDTVEELLPERSNFLVDFNAHDKETACFACFRGAFQLLAMIGVVLFSILCFGVKYLTVAVITAEGLALFGSIKYDEDLTDEGTLQDNSEAAKGMREDIGIGAIVLTALGLLIGLVGRCCLPPRMAASSKPWAGALLLVGVQFSVIWVYRGLPDSGGTDGLVDSVFALFIGLSLLLGSRTFAMIAAAMNISAHIVVVRLWHSVGIFGNHWEYNEQTWDVFLWICALATLLMPMILWFDSNKMRWYYQWRLADAFDLNDVKEQDLKETKFISGMATHRWQYTNDIEGGIVQPTRDAIAVDFSESAVIRARSINAKETATLAGYIPTKRPVSQKEHNEWYQPRLLRSPNSLRLVETVAISGSAVAEEFGKFPAGRCFPIVIKLAGCSLGAWMTRRVEKGSDAPSLTLLRCGYAIIPGAVLCCIFALWGVYIAQDTPLAIRYFIFALTILYMLMLLCVVSCGGCLKSPQCKNSLGRWCYDSVALILHSIFEMTELSDEFPELTYFTDGGHVDNTGLIAYLAAMLNRDVEGGTVFMVDGSTYNYCAPFADLENALDDAQRRLGVRIGSDPVTMTAYGEEGKMCATKQFAGGIGEALTHVRHFPYEARSVVVGPIKIRMQYLMDNDESEPFQVFFGRLLPHPTNTSSAPGMCCECCHTCCRPCGGLSKRLFGEFPSHSTGWQFFTKTLFNEYQHAATKLGRCMREQAFRPPLPGATTQTVLIETPTTDRTTPPEENHEGCCWLGCFRGMELGRYDAFSSPTSR